MALAESDVIFWHDYANGSGTSVTDESGSYNLSLVNTPTWGATGVPSNLIGYVEMNGTNQYGEIASATDLDIGSRNTTLAAWVYTDDITSRQSIMGKGDLNANWFTVNFEGSGFSNNMGFLTDDAADFDFIRGGAASISNSTWLHVVVTFDATTDDRYLYINNTQVASNTTDAIGDITSAQDFYVGRLLTSGSPIWYLNGRVAQTIMLNKVIDSSERSTLYNAGGGALYTDVFGGGGGGFTKPNYLGFSRL